MKVDWLNPLIIIIHNGKSGKNVLRWLIAMYHPSLKVWASSISSSSR